MWFLGLDIGFSKAIPGSVQQLKIPPSYLRDCQVILCIYANPWVKINFSIGRRPIWLVDCLDQPLLWGSRWEYASVDLLILRDINTCNRVAIRSTLIQHISRLWTSSNLTCRFPWSPFAVGLVTTAYVDWSIDTWRRCGSSRGCLYRRSCRCGPWVPSRYLQEWCRRFGVLPVWHCHLGLVNRRIWGQCWLPNCLVCFCIILVRYFFAMFPSDDLSGWLISKFVFNYFF